MKTETTLANGTWVVGDSGFIKRYGKVSSKLVTQFGTFTKVSMCDGTEETVSQFMVAEHTTQIGWYVCFESMKNSLSFKHRFDDAPTHEHIESMMEDFEAVTR